MSPCSSTYRILFINFFLPATLFLAIAMLCAIKPSSRFLQQFILSPFRCPKSGAFQFARMTATLPSLPLFEAIASHDPHSTVVIHSASGRRFTYGELLKDVADAKDRLHKEAPSTNINGQRIAFLVENGYDYVGALQGISAYFRRVIDRTSSDFTLHSGRKFNSSPSFPCFSDT